MPAIASTLSAEEFATRLRTVREERGVKRAELARRLGTTGQAYGRYERGERIPSVAIAKGIADALGVSLDYLVGEASAAVKDRRMLYRLELLDRVAPAHRERILYALDALLKHAQADALDARLS